MTRAARFFAASRGGFGHVPSGPGEDVATFTELMAAAPSLPQPPPSTRKINWSIVWRAWSALWAVAALFSLEDVGWKGPDVLILFLVLTALPWIVRWVIRGSLRKTA
jgi:hypothetical protein